MNNLSFKQKVAGFLLALVALLGGGYSASTLGGAGDGFDYSTTTRQAVTGAAITNLRVLKTGPGALSNVVITGAAAGIMNFYDATSTVTNTAWPTTTLAAFPVSAAAGSYLLDATFTKGLLIEVGALTPTSTVTWK